MNPIPLAEPDITRDDIAAVTRVLESTTLALGPEVSGFEEEIAAYVGTRHAVACNSGTSALHLLVRALGVTPGDEVITTSFSFAASTNCLLYEGAIPAFVDIDPLTLCLDPERVEAAVGPRTVGILAVDVFGHPAAWDLLERIAADHRLWLIEDSAEALGSELRGRRCGSFGDGAVFGFYPNKQITTGEGGMLVTDSPEIAARCRSMANQGRGDGDTWLQHVRLGYNYRLDEMSAALGRSQLRRIEAIVRARSEVADHYGQLLTDVAGVIPSVAARDVRVSWFVYVVRLDESSAPGDRERIMRRLEERGVACRPYFEPIHLQSFHRNRCVLPRDGLPVTEAVGSRTIALPFHNRLRPTQIRRVVEALAASLEGR